VKPERNLGSGEASIGERRTNPRPRGIKSRNRRMRTRMYGGVGGEESRGFPYPDYPTFWKRF
jgi:hypothetical protein